MRPALIDRSRFIQGVNFKTGLPYRMVRQLMETNAQFIIELATPLKM